MQPLAFFIFAEKYRCENDWSTTPRFISFPLRAFWSMIFWRKRPKRKDEVHEFPVWNVHEAHGRSTAVGRNAPSRTQTIILQVIYSLSIENVVCLFTVGGSVKLQFGAWADGLSWIIVSQFASRKNCRRRPQSAWLYLQTWREVRSSRWRRVEIEAKSTQWSEFFRWGSWLPRVLGRRNRSGPDRVGYCLLWPSRRAGGVRAQHTALLDILPRELFSSCRSRTRCERWSHQRGQCLCTLPGSKSSYSLCHLEVAVTVSLAETRDSLILYSVRTEMTCLLVVRKNQTLLRVFGWKKWRRADEGIFFCFFGFL